MTMGGRRRCAEEGRGEDTISVGKESSYQRKGENGRGEGRKSRRSTNQPTNQQLILFQQDFASFPPSSIHCLAILTLNHKSYSKYFNGKLVSFVKCVQNAQMHIIIQLTSFRDKLFLRHIIASCHMSDCRSLTFFFCTQLQWQQQRQL